MSHRPFLAATVALVVATTAPTQEIRFELGQRLRAMERALAEHHDRAALKRAIDPLERATPTFFRGQLTEAARLLDEARFALRSADAPPDAVRWAESLAHRPATRLLDRAAGELKVTTDVLYPVKTGRPDRPRVRHTLCIGDRCHATVSADLTPTPIEVQLVFKDVPEGDYRLRSEVLSGDGKPLAGWEQTVSLVTDLMPRLRGLHAALKPLEKVRTTDRATLTRLVGLLADLEQRRPLETNVPAARLLTEAEALLGAIRAGTAYHGRERPGEHWLTLQGEADTYPVRVRVPPAVRTAKAVPLVIALHGAGGSENMFFDGYGDGLIARLCAERGWLLVTTRSPLFAFSGVDAPVVVDALAQLYPVDRMRVFLVGHSMGAAQAVGNAGRQPERFRAVAALGGGGGFKVSDGLKAVRFFVGVGERDFALGGARTLHRRLLDAGVSRAEWRTYPDVEHLTVVQHALPDVFAFFDSAAGR